jgi:hypothetical protein
MDSGQEILVSKQLRTGTLVEAFDGAAIAYLEHVCTIYCTALVRNNAVRTFMMHFFVDESYEARKIGRCSDVAHGIYFAPPHAHKASPYG